MVTNLRYLTPLTPDLRYLTPPDALRYLTPLMP